MLERYVWESSMDVLEDAERSLLSNEQEALVRRELRLMKERERKRKNLLNDDEVSEVF